LRGCFISKFFGSGVKITSPLLVVPFEIKDWFVFLSEFLDSRREPFEEEVRLEVEEAARLEEEEAVLAFDSFFVFF